MSLLFRCNTMHIIGYKDDRRGSFSVQNPTSIDFFCAHYSPQIHSNFLVCTKVGRTFGCLLILVQIIEEWLFFLTFYFRSRIIDHNFKVDINWAGQGCIVYTGLFYTPRYELIYEGRLKCSQVDQDTNVSSLKDMQVYQNTTECFQFTKGVSIYIYIVVSI